MLLQTVLACKFSGSFCQPVPPLHRPLVPAWPGHPPPPPPVFPAWNTTPAPRSCPRSGGATPRCLEGGFGEPSPVHHSQPHSHLPSHPRGVQPAHPLGEGPGEKGGVGTALCCCPGVQTSTGTLWHSRCVLRALGAPPGPRLQPCPPSGVWGGWGVLCGTAPLLSLPSRWCLLHCTVAVTIRRRTNPVKCKLSNL